MRLRVALALLSSLGVSHAAPRFAPAKDGVPICTCEPLVARTMRRGDGRVLVVSRGEGPLLLVAAPVAWPSFAATLGPATLRTRSFAVVDVNHDGALDVFAPSATPDGPTALFVSTSDGFVDRAPSLLPALAGSVLATAWGDLDGDGLVDLVVVRDDGPEVLLDDGSGHFQRAEGERLPRLDDDTPKGSAVYEVLAIDVDADLDLDLVIMRRFGRGRVLVNDGKGTFTERKAGVPSRGAPSSRSVDFADLDAQGTLDLVVTGAPVAGAGPVSWLLGPSFSQSALVDDATLEDLGVRTIDATSDGRVDVIGASASPAGLRLLATTAIGLELDASAFPPWADASPPAVFDVGDFDRDANPDVFGARRDGTTFFLRGLAEKPQRERPARAMRIGGFVRAAPGEPITAIVALRDATAASLERPFERAEIIAKLGETMITPLYVRHVGGDLVRVELPPMNEGDVLHFEAHFFDGRGDDLVVGPVDLLVTAAPPAGGEQPPPSSPTESASMEIDPSEPKAWSCAVSPAGAPYQGRRFALEALGAAALAAFGSRRTRRRPHDRR